MASKEKLVKIALEILIGGGLIAALLTFLVPHAWTFFTHKPLSEKYVDASLRFEKDTFFVYVRNASDEPLDLKEAAFRLDSAFAFVDALGAYPELSHVYRVESKHEAKLLTISDKEFEVKLKIIQSIEPGETDMFGFQLIGPTGIVDLSSNKIVVELTATNGAVFHARM